MKRSAQFRSGSAAALAAAAACALLGISRAEVPANIDDLVGAGKYETAFNALEKADPQNKDPAVFIRKIDLAVHYSVLCINNQMFAFKDLEPGEDLAKLRGNPGTYSMHAVDVAKDGAALIEQAPADGRLRKAIGDWYFQGLQRCGQKGSEGEAISSYREAEKLGVADAAMLQRLGTLLLEQGKAEDAIVELQAALKLDDASADVHYNLAHANYTLKHDAVAAQHAQRAFDLYKDQKLKSEAALLAAFTLYEAGDKAAALKYADSAETLKSGNSYYIVGKLLGLYVRAGELSKARDQADELFALEPTNPRLAQDVLAAYAKPALPGEVKAFFERNLPKYADNKTAHGNLLFHYSDYFIRLGDNAEAIQRLEAAREDFRSQPDANVQALQAIDVRLSVLREKSPGDKPPAR